MTATRLSGLPAATRSNARVLVLGSMPGAASLSAKRYYAHPRNAFWPIMGALCGAGLELPYAQRLARLDDAGIALWDVLAHCERAGSLDARIEPGSIVVNDFEAFFAAHPQVALVAFNGGTAARMFERHATHGLRAGVATTTLPSTSPAYAAMRFEDKLAAWRAALAPHLCQRRPA